MLSGDVLVRSIGVAFTLALAVLTVSTLRGNGWNRRRSTEAALSALRELMARFAARRRRWQAKAAAKAARLLAVRRHPALVQLNLRVKMARRSTGASAPAFLARRRFPTLSAGRELNFDGRLEDLAGLYLSPPEHALVWCRPESRSLHAVTRASQQAGAVRAAVLSHEMLGSTPLSEALMELSGSVIGSCDRAQRHGQWLKFLSTIDRQTPPGWQLHVMCDNQATQDHPSVREWLTAHPHVRVQNAAGPDSGLKMVKRFFDHAIAEQLGVRTFQSVADLTAAIADHLARRLTEAGPFIWIRQPQELSATAPASRMPGTKPG